MQSAALVVFPSTLVWNAQKLEPHVSNVRNRSTLLRSASKLSAASETAIDLNDQTILATVTLEAAPGSKVVEVFIKGVKLEGLIESGSS